MSPDPKSGSLGASAAPLRPLRDEHGVLRRMPTRRDILDLGCRDVVVSQALQLYHNRACTYEEALAVAVVELARQVDVLRDEWLTLYQRCPFLPGITVGPSSEGK